MYISGTGLWFAPSVLCHLFGYGVCGVWHESHVKECGALDMHTGALQPGPLIGPRRGGFAVDGSTRLAGRSSVGPELSTEMDVF